MAGSGGIPAGLGSSDRDMRGDLASLTAETASHAVGDAGLRASLAG